MVYTERTDKYQTTTSKDNAEKTKTRSNSISASSSSASSKCQTSSPGSGAWSSQATNAEKWKYNNMVKDNRDKFNGLHFS